MPEIAPVKLECDLVMRGGIASGLVYPHAIAAAAEHASIISSSDGGS